MNWKEREKQEITNLIFDISMILIFCILFVFVIITL